MSEPSTTRTKVVDRVCGKAGPLWRERTHEIIGCPRLITSASVRCRRVHGAWSAPGVPAPRIDFLIFLLHFWFRFPPYFLTFFRLRVLSPVRDYF